MKRRALVASLLAAPLAGAQTTPSAASGDGAWRLEALQPPAGLALFDATGAVVRRYATTTLDGRASSRVSAIRDNPKRRSFVLALPEIAEVWEISYDPKAEPIYDGLVHDWRLGEGIATPGRFGVRRTRLERREAVERFEFDATGARVIDLDRGTVIHLDVRRVIAPPQR
ncbi:MAG TPA: cytochrome D1 domain-containing protein [Burkholderiaceae bacterium]|nr:cytochrome D1 domain-containing protein [Burkholderiaceae bacterium]